jgi:hypothetical protein
MSQPKFEGIDAVYKSKADNKDIRDLLEKLVPKAKAQMVEFSKRFKGQTDEQTCRNIFNYLMNHFTYVADGEEQIIKMPSALLKKKVGDCKSYSLFTASILENLNIPYTITYTSYNSNPIPQHVYIVTQKGCIIDAVYGKFNQEKTPTYKYKKNMNVRYMAGINGCGCGGNCGCNKGMGNIFDDAKKKRDQLLNYAKEQEAKAKALRDKVLAEADKLKQGSKTIGLSAGRNLFLILIKNNIDGFASKLSTGNTTPLLNKWYELGGDRTILAKALKTGASKPEKKFGLLGKLKTILKNNNVNSLNINGIGAIPAAAKAAIITACTTAGAAIAASSSAALATPIGAGSGATLGEVINQVLPMIIDAVNKVPTTEELAANAPLNTKAVDNIDANSEELVIRDKDGNVLKLDSKGSGVLNDWDNKNNNTMLYVGGAALLAAGIYFATKKK